MLRLGLRLKLLAGVILILLPLLALTVAQIEAARARERESVLAGQTRTAQVTAAFVDSVFDEAISVGWAVAADPLTHALSPQQLDAHLQELAGRYPQFLNITVFNVRGDDVGTSTPYAPGEDRINIADVEFFQRVLATRQPNISEVRVARRFGGLPIVVATVPVLEAGVPVGVVNVLFDTAQFPRRLASVGLLSGQAVGLFDRAGRIAFLSGRSELTWEERERGGELPEVRLALGGQTVQRDDWPSPFFGDRRLAAFVPTPRYGWAVSVTWPIEQALAPVDAAARDALLAFAVVLGFALGGAWLVSGFLTGPIRRLSNQALAISRGKLGQQVEVRTGDELEVLADAFNWMSRWLAALFARIPAGVLVVRLPDFVVEYANRYFEAIPGEPVAMVGRPLVDVLPRAAEEGVLAILEQVARTGEPFESREFEYTGLSRGPTYWHLTAQAVPDPDDVNRRLVVTLVEATTSVVARRRLEELAAQAQRQAGQLRAVIESMADAVVIVDVGGQLVDANPAAMQLLGLTREWLGRGLREYAALLEPRWPDGRPMRVEDLPMSRTLRGEVFTAMEVWLRTLRNEDRLASVSGGPVRNERGEVALGVSVLRDVTEERRREREREAIVQVAAVLVSEADLVSVADTVVEQTRRSLLAPRVLLWLAQPDRRELELIAQRGISRRVEPVLRVLSYDAPLPFAATARTGRLIMIEDTAAPSEFERSLVETEGIRSLVSLPLNVRGHLVGVLAYGHTEPRRFPEEEITLARTLADLFALAIERARLYEELQDEVRLREEFLNAAAKELGGPVTRLKGYAAVLERRLDGGSPELQKAVQAIKRDSAQVGQLAQDLDVANRIAAGELTLHRDRFDLGELAREIAGHCQSMKPSHQFILSTEPAVVEADRDRIAEVIRHLLENAIKYQPQGGPIDLLVRRQNGDAVLSVRDRGIGIPAERQRHIFEPLYEPLPPGGVGYVGIAGLGLYLSKQLVVRHGGRIWFKSEFGKGSTFSFGLPLATYEPHPRPSATPSPPSGEGDGG